jgi:hypothetical protein
MHQALRRKIALTKFRMTAYKCRRRVRKLGRAYRRASETAQAFSCTMRRVLPQQ